MKTVGTAEARLRRHLTVGFILSASLTLVYSACEKSPTAPAKNAAPTVTVAFQGPSSCTPPPGKSCTLDVAAQATDPDGDPLGFAWSGCASGNAAKATCTVESAGQVVASVQVSDDHGHTVSGSATGEGLVIPNAAPTVRVVFQSASSCTVRSGARCSVGVIAQATDPDGDTLQYVWSGCASGSSPDAQCTVDRVGSVLATVEVSDGHDHTVAASAAAQGLAPTNAPPIVTAAFQGPSACTPMPGKPCTLNVAAEASDPEGDPLGYRWSGCATGTSRTAVCVVDRPGQITASVDVSDGQGNTTTAAAVGTGSNKAPFVQIGYVVPLGVNTIELLGNVLDPEEGLICARQECVGLSTSGECRVGLFDCTCLAGLEAEIIRMATSGTCTATFRVKDSWGEIGTTSITLDLATRTRAASSTPPASVSPRRPQHP